jgi:hypothetical protein
MLTWLAWLSLTLAIGSAVAIAIDEASHPQKMSVMNVVWPVTGLYLSVFALWWYFRAGRSMAKDAPAMNMASSANKPPTATQTALAASHCGAGCALADILAESSIFSLGIAIAGSTLLASYVYDLLAAWLLGIAFQYFSIKPMGELSPAAALLAAIKADTLSILAFQVGMYAWMALARYRVFPGVEPDSPIYWLSMQAGMICGFLTAMPMNRFLIAKGWKEKMG